MKKRILSLLMAVCLVVAAVPSLLLSAVAEEAGSDPKTLVTKMEDNGENYPEYESGKRFIGYKGGWTFGYLNPDLDYSEFHVFNGDYDSITPAGSLWDFGGVYIGNKGFHYQFALRAFENGGYSTVAAYKSFYQGKVDLAIEDLKSGYAGTGSSPVVNLYVAIFIDGEMVWPVKGGTYYKEDEAGDFAEDQDWYHLTSDTDISQLMDAMAGKTDGIPADKLAAMHLENLKDIDVMRGSQIQFAFTIGPVVTGTTNNNIVQPTLSVTFQEGYKRVPDLLKTTFGPRSSEWPTSRIGRGIGTNNQEGKEWSLGSVTNLDGELTYTAFARHYKSTGDGWMGDYELPADDSTNPTPNYTERGGIIISSGLGRNGYFMLPNDGEARLAYDVFLAYNCQSVATGKAALALNDLALLDKEGNPAAEGKTAEFHVLQNGAVALKVTIAAKADGTAEITGLRDATGAETETPVLNVVKDDNLTLMLASADADVWYVGAFPAINYSGITSFTADAELDMNIEDAELVVGHGFGLKLGVYGKSEIYNAKEVGYYVWAAGTAEADQTEANATKVIASDNGNFAYVAELDDFIIAEIADDFTVQAYAKVGETVYYSPKTTRSMADWVLAEYNDPKTSDRQKALCAALLNYGAAAQKYFEHNVENLANAGLPEEAKTVDDTIQYFAKLDAVNTPATMCYSEIRGFSLILGNTIGIRVYVNVDDRDANTTSGETNVQIQVADSASNLRTSQSLDARNSFVIEDIGLNEMSTVYYMRVGAKPVRQMVYGYTLTYSVESYVARMCEDHAAGTVMGDLIRTMMEFGKLAAK